MTGKCPILVKYFMITWWGLSLSRFVSISLYLHVVKFRYPDSAEYSATQKMMKYSNYSTMLMNESLSAQFHKMAMISMVTPGEGLFGIFFIWMDCSSLSCLCFVIFSHRSNNYFLSTPATWMSIGVMADKS